ncbi:MAG: type 4a pilus biogenesis protein PilO, partial [Candidatus Paceibacterota bacterium]
MNKNLIASVAFGLSIFLFLVLVIPQYDGIRGTNAAIGERELILLERTAAIERVRSLDRQVTERQADINKIVVFLPEDKQIDQILSSIEQVSQQSGLQLVTITSSDATS